MRPYIPFQSSRNLYLLVLLIATLTTLPWIGLGGYYTKGEPREASVAVSMINDGNWILPRVYADEIPYKPPLTHWMIAVCSVPGGEVTPFTSRLPSAIAFIIMVGCCFHFFMRFLKRDEALIAIFILLSCFEIHRAGMTSRVDMVLTAFMVCGMISLFYWAEDKQLEGLPWHIPLLLGCAALVKGPVGIILPLLAFGIFLLSTQRNLLTVILKCLLAGVLSLLPLLVWYYLAYRQAGESFINLVWAENFGRFLGSDNLKIHYGLGHEHPFWFNFILLLSGFIPWTLFLFFSLFAIRYKPRKTGSNWRQTLSMERGTLFSAIAACTVILFYCIPISKRGVYLMPAYPFIAVLMGKYIYSIVTNHPTVNRVFAITMGVIAGITLLLSVSMLLGVIDLPVLVSEFTGSDKIIYQTSLIYGALSKPALLYIILLVCFPVLLVVLYAQFRKKSQTAILYATVSLWLLCNVLLDGVALPALKNGMCVKGFAEKITEQYPLKEGNMFVVNNLHRYGNLYELNFYLNNRFGNFEKEQPESGFFFSTATDIGNIRKEYDNYQFELLEETSNKFNGARAIVQLYKFKRD